MRDFTHLDVYSAIFWVLKITYSQDDLADFDGKYAKNVVLCKEVPILWSQNQNLNSRPTLTQNNCHIGDRFQRDLKVFPKPVFTLDIFPCKRRLIVIVARQKKLE